MNCLFAQTFSGMELIPFMVLALAVAMTFSILGFITAFLHRITGRVCAGLAVGGIGVFAFIVLAVNDWNFGWLISVLLEASPINGVVDGSLLLSLAAAFLPLRRKSEGASEETPRIERPSWWICILAFLAAIFILSCLIFTCILAMLVADFALIPLLPLD